MFWKKQNEGKDERARAHFRYTTNVRHSYANPLFPKKDQASPLKKFSFRGKAILAGIVVLFALWFVMFSEVLRVKDIFIEGNEELTDDQIRQTVTSYLQIRRWFILPQSNILLLSSGRLINSLNSAHVFESVNVDKHFRHQSLSVNVKERIPGLTFISQNTAYYLDLHGVVTHEVGEGEEVRKTFPVVKDFNNRETRLKNQMMTEEMIQSLFSIHTLLPQKTSFTVDSYILPKVTCRKTIKEEVPARIEENLNTSAQETMTNTQTNSQILNANNSQMKIQRTVTQEREIEAPCENYLTTIKSLNVRLKEGPEIFFDATRSIEEQIEKLRVSMTQELRDKKGLDYIDLRFEDRVYYK